MTPHVPVVRGTRGKGLRGRAAQARKRHQKQHVNPHSYTPPKETA